MAQSFDLIPFETPAGYWVLSSSNSEGITETLFYGEKSLFECFYFIPSNYALSMCDFEEIEPEKALDHYNAFSYCDRKNIRVAYDDQYL